MLENVLQNIGLRDKQAKIYLALLELGQTSVQDLAKRAGINRTTAYVVLEELIKENLARVEKKGKKDYYTAVEPDYLEQWLEKKKKIITSQKEAVNKVIKKVKAKYSLENKDTTVRYFEGKEGILENIKEIMQNVKNDKVQMFYNVDNVDKYFTSDERKVLTSNRLNKKVNTEVIYLSSDRRLNKASRGDVRIRIPIADFPNQCDIALYPKSNIRIVFFQNSKPYGIIIKNTQIYQALLSLFKLSWLGAQEKEIY